MYWCLLCYFKVLFFSCKRMYYHQKKSIHAINHRFFLFVAILEMLRSARHSNWKFRLRAAEMESEVGLIYRSQVSLALRWPLIDWSSPIGGSVLLQLAVVAYRSLTAKGDLAALLARRGQCIFGYREFVFRTLSYGNLQLHLFMSVPSRDGAFASDLLQFFFGHANRNGIEFCARNVWSVRLT